jgi:hypothetical protein
MIENYHRIMNAIRRSEERIKEAHESSEDSRRIEEIEREHIGNLRDLLAEPMSENIIEEDFSIKA